MRNLSPQQKQEVFVALNGLATVIGAQLIAEFTHSTHATYTFHMS